MICRIPLILLGIFLLSVAIRLPNLNRPLSKHHEFCTAITLIPLQNWADNGAATYHYSPSITFEGAANHHIENLTAYPVEANGRFYYLSHPPFAYLLPYFSFKIFGIYPTPLALQVFNLLFHFLSCLLIYYIVVLLCKNDENLTSNKLHFGALTAFLIYLFAPATLWFHGNAYMSDMFISNIFIFGLWLALKAYQSMKYAYIVGLCITIFLMIYTEWLGNFFAFGVFIAALIFTFKSDSKHRKYWLAVTFACIAGVVLGLTLIFVQYSSIAGSETYLSYFEHRFFARSGAKFTDTDLFSFLYKYLKLTRGVVKHYAVGFLPVLLFGMALCGAFFFHSKKIIRQENIAVRYFWWIAGFPILMHHLIFIEFTVVHDFAVLKGGILIAVGIGLLIHRLPHSAPLRVGVLATLSICIVQYYYINRPGEISQNGDRYDMMQKLGEGIGKHSTSDEIVFLNGYKPDPQVMYYARRNMLRATDTLEVKKALKTRGFERGVLFTIDNYKIKRIDKVSLK